ncbi:MAG: LCP family protein [Candidatus Uhrbacteria bacterium]
MPELNIDFLKKKYDSDSTKRRPLNFFGRAFLAIIIIGAMSAAALSQHVAISGNEEDLTFFETVRRLVTSSEKLLAGEEEDRINILALGIGGEGHDGPELTDTIIFASYRPSTDEMGILSIPRDLTVYIPGYDWRKINNINAFGEINEEGSGPEFASEVIGEVLGQDIHYWVKVDFDGFADLIDDLGGVNIYVEQSFVDNQYPTDDYLTQTISFDQGWQKMDGQIALQYVRSRHGTNGEGSDFARARRQQNLLMAVKDKVLSAGTLLNPSKINRIFETLQDHVQTNLSTWQILRLATMGRDVNPENIKNHVLDNSPEGPLYDDMINGAYVLLPKNDDWGMIRRIAANVFNDSISSYIATEPIEQEPEDLGLVKVEIQNGTNITGYAFQTSQHIYGQGFDVVKIGNANERNYEQTIIYDLTNGQQPEQLTLIQEFLQADIYTESSGWSYAQDVDTREMNIEPENPTLQTTEDDIDFLIILGEASVDLVMR